jgi:predicted esterase
MARRGKRISIRAATGMLSVLAGALLALRPFSGHTLLVVAVVSSLVVAAVAELVQGTWQSPARWVSGAAYFGGAVLIAAWPGVPISAIGLVVGLLLLSTGALEIWSALLSRTQLPALLVGAADGGPWVALFSGVTTLVLGVVSVLWTDSVLLPMTVTLAMRLLLVGAGLLVDIWYPPTEYGVSTERLRLIWRSVGLLVAVAIFVSGLSVSGIKLAPSGFYQVEVPAGAAAGDLIRAESYEPGVDGGTAVRLLYVTKDPSGEMTAASAVLYVPATTVRNDLPLVVWAHNETGIAPSCAPSLLGEASGGLTAVPQMLAAGYAVLVPDYVGLGVSTKSSYLVGESEGRALLDAIRAAGKVPGARIGAAVIWGYSQGGHAALWAGQLQPSYASEVKLAGIAADAPLTDLAAVMSSAAKTGAYSTQSAFLLTSYAERYPDIEVGDYLSVAERLRAEETAARCGEIGWANRNWSAITGANGSWAASPQSGALAARLSENTPAGTFITPLLITEGSDDQLIPKAAQDAAVAERCQQGQKLLYRVYPGIGHDGPATVGSARFDDVMSWISNRFAGKAAPDNCS